MQTVCGSFYQHQNNPRALTLTIQMDLAYIFNFNPVSLFTLLLGLSFLIAGEWRRSPLAAALFYARSSVLQFAGHPWKGKKKQEQVATKIGNVPRNAKSRKTKQKEPTPSHRISLLSSFSLSRHNSQTRCLSLVGRRLFVLWISSMN